MHHTRESMRRNRGLVMIIMTLTVAWALEPSFRSMASVCSDLLRYGFGGP